jgi:uncharacterized protein YbjT (DUF2867 family)
MRVLVTAARGKTGRRVIAALRRQAPASFIRALSRGDFGEDSVEALTGDMDDPDTRARAVEGMDVVVHYAPPMHPREVAMGTGMIDAAAAAGVRRFVFISVIHPEIDDLLNHQAKLRVEAHLINSGLNWTVLRPQHYFQNVDVRQAVAQGVLVQPYPPSTRLGHVDMNDLAEAAAKVVMDPAHAYATYDIASGEHLTVDDLCATITAASGSPVRPHEVSPADVVAHIAAHHRLTPYSEEAFHRLFGYYARRGIYGNPNVLTWLLGRAPTSFQDYAIRCLEGREGPVGNAR